jgi:bifunctional NMN adenylyltransferase/nudix hydrolase
MSKKYDLIVYIGRFQPFHNAHYEILCRAKALAKNVIVIIGSAEQPRTYKNPFTDYERKMIMISDWEISMHCIKDSMYNDQAWAIRVQEAVSTHVYDNFYPDDENIKIGIIGHEKDESSFYLKMFPQWDHIDVECIEPLHSTDIRELYFRKDANMNFIKGVVPEHVFEFLKTFKETEHYQQIIKEREFIQTYKKQFEHLPYPPVFVTADSVVIQSGHVLMVKRRAEPGKGLLALPGGFLETTKDKSIIDCAIRELKEETGIKVPVPVLLGSIKGSKVFDAIGRSARGRTITNAVHIQLPDGDLPKVKGMDDAEKALWIPIGELSSSECFEDHYDIISYFVGGSL